LSLAIRLVLDLEVIDYICQKGACLQNGWEVSLGEPDILSKLRQTTTVSEARKQSCFVKGIVTDCFLRLVFVAALHPRMGI
jgi:hypothetical protein